MIPLRGYQQEAIDALYTYFEERKGNPIVDLPTGSGKSVVLGGFVYRACCDDAGVRILVVTHRKELIKQDADKILAFWLAAPLGIYSAGLKRKEIRQITVAGIQSIHSKMKKDEKKVEKGEKVDDPLGAFDLMIVDECHLIGSGGQYRELINELRKRNPKLRVIGLSATPYRMDSGLLTEGDDRIFTDIAYTADTGRLILEGYLSPLISKAGLTKADLKGLHTRMGEFLPDEIAARMDIPALVRGACEEIVGYGRETRKSWLIFCSGVRHAQNVADCLRSIGVNAVMVCGETPNDERDQILADFKAGKIQCITNADLLTTGFDHPAIDLIALLRPTQSVGLFVQMLGRGLRKHPDKENCLVLDFAGNVLRHGTIDCIKPPKKKGEGGGVAPVKECPSCQAYLPTSAKECGWCGHTFARMEEKQDAPHEITADDSPIVGALQRPQALKVENVFYYAHHKEGRPPSLRVVYRCGLDSYSKWVAVESPDQYVQKHVHKWFAQRGYEPAKTVREALLLKDDLPWPSEIVVAPSGRFWEVVEERFDWKEQA